MDNQLELVGVDIGHGESAIAVAATGCDAEPKIAEVHGKKSVISALGIAKDGRVLIGEDAFTSQSLDSLHIRFKSRRFETDNSLALKRFIGRIVDILRADAKIGANGSTRFVVGVPSGWNAETRAQYTQLLREAGLHEAMVMAESRAAFIGAREEKTLALTDEVLNGSVLIVDIGSSTTDFTSVLSLREQVLDHGNNDLGGSLIEQLQFRRLLEEHEKCSELKQLFDQHPYYGSICELKCRKAKEEFFSNEERFSDQPAIEAQRLPTVRPLYFEAAFGKADAEWVFCQPIAALGNRTWPNAFEQSLRECKSKLANSPPKLVLLTGGASRMNFTLDICKRVFPDARIARGAEPEFAIARGLAWAGRIDHNSRSLQDEVNRLITSSAIEGAIEAKVPGLMQKIARRLVEALPGTCIVPAFNEWRAGRIRTLRDLESEAGKRMEEWFQGPAGSNLISKAMQNWFEELRPDIERLTDPICEKYRIPRKALGIPMFAGMRERQLSGRLLESVDLIGFDDFAAVVTIIGSLIMATLLGGGGIALLMSGPIGWIIGFIGSAVVLFVGANQAREYIKDLEIPTLGRQLASADGIPSSLREKTAEIEAKIVDGLKQRPEELKAISKDIGESIRAELTKASDTARLYIR